MLGKRSIDALAPLLEGDGPNADNEWAMHCPYHGDRRRSASVNIETELWHCMGCNAGGEARDLIRDKENWNLDSIQANGYSHGKSKRSASQPQEEITEAKLEGWHQALLSNREALKELMRVRSLTRKTIKLYQLGWDSSANKGHGAYTIPVRDMAGEIVNVRRYTPNPQGDRRKIWSVAGMGSGSLFPVDQLENDAIVICEGEMDAMLTIQNGIPAITRTGTADQWKPEWSEMFRGKRVYICHDMDSKGQLANKKVAAALRHKAKEVTIVTLPFEITEDHGLDLTDFWQAGASRADFLLLIKQGERIKTDRERLRDDEPKIVTVNVMDSFDASLVERPLLIQATVTGKKIPSYLIPKEVVFNCSMDAGKRCENCSMRTTAGEIKRTVEATEPLVLSMINVSDQKVLEVLREDCKIAKCTRFEMSVLSRRTVEEIYIRPSIEISSGVDQDFTHRKVISAASHDLSSNQTVDLIGTIRPNPLSQTNEFQAWQVRKPTNTLESFALNEEEREMLREFQTDDEPLEKLEEIAEELSHHVTKIYHRPEMHMFMDIVFHSGLEFKLDKEETGKGWLDAIIIGDTRTGKSEAAGRLIGEYGMGEMVSCESATYAGVVGGLDRTSDNRWIVKWGSIPINDKRAVVLDEVSGLQPEQIAQMSSIRSSGVAEMTKIQNERALARTRLLWLANPRNARMDDYTFGVQALQPLVGNNEDIARFDMAMGVFSTDVAAELINKPPKVSGSRVYTTDALRACLRWAWTRTAAEIVLGARTVAEVRAQATALGREFVEVPPLIQGANVRWKLARVAVAIAMRTFNVGVRGECVVEPRHVTAAADFLRLIYGNPSFGYGATSDQRRADVEQTRQHLEQIMQYIDSRPGLARFLRHTPVFERTAVEVVMNMSREASSAMINDLWNMKALVYEDTRLKLEPEVLRQVRMLKDVE